MPSIFSLRIAAIATLGMIAVSTPVWADDVAAGGKLYVGNCLGCHGDKGQGGAGKKLAGDAAYWDFPVFKRTVIEGVDDEGKELKGMPVFGKTGLLNPQGTVPTDDDLHNVQAYLKTFGPPE